MEPGSEAYCGKSRRNKFKCGFRIMYYKHCTEMCIKDSDQDKLTAILKLPFLLFLHRFESMIPAQMPKAARTNKMMINIGMTIPRAMAVVLLPPGGGVGTASHVLLPSSSLRHDPQRLALLGPRQPAPGTQERSQDASSVGRGEGVGEREREREREK